MARSAQQVAHVGIAAPLSIGVAVTCAEPQREATVAQALKSIGLPTSTGFLAAGRRLLAAAGGAPG